MATTFGFLALLVAIATMPSLCRGSLFGGCSGLPSFANFRAALRSAVQIETLGLNFHMWGTLVNRDGLVCAVAYSGPNIKAQWAASRLISASKAYTANSLALDNTSFASGSGSPTGFTLSTANLYSAIQPGGALYGLAEANPINADAAYDGFPFKYGSVDDPLVGKIIGGYITFGGGLALYAPGGVAVGGVGVSGDTACADHRIAWRLRNLLNLDYLSGLTPVTGDARRPDNILYLGANEAPNGFKHPNCLDGDDPSTLPPVKPQISS